jgi:hypothetical protein
MRSLIKSIIVFFSSIGVVFLAADEAPLVESVQTPQYIALHAAPHEVATIVMTVPVGDPLLEEAAPVLIPTDDPSMPPRQNPWRWVEVSAVFTGYISRGQMDEENRPMSGASILAAPDVDSPLLTRAESVADSLRVVRREGPFAQVRFEASLPLFVDTEAEPRSESIRLPARPVVAESRPVAPDEAMVAEAVAVEIEQPAAARAVPQPDHEATVEAPAPAIVVPVEPSPVVRMLHGRLVSARDVGMRRSAYAQVIVSPSGRPLAFADMSFFRSAPLSQVLGREGVFTGAVIPAAEGRGNLPVMQVRTFRAH